MVAFFAGASFGAKRKAGENPARTRRCNLASITGMEEPFRQNATVGPPMGRRWKGGEARRPASRNVWWRRQILQALILIGVWGIFIMNEKNETKGGFKHGIAVKSG